MRISIQSRCSISSERGTSHGRHTQNSPHSGPIKSTSSLSTSYFTISWTCQMSRLQCMTAVLTAVVHLQGLTMKLLNCALIFMNQDSMIIIEVETHLNMFHSHLYFSPCSLIMLSLTK